MKIIIDAFQYSPAITGTDRMAFNFLAELQKIDRTNKYIVLCSRETYTRSVISNENFKIWMPPLVVTVPILGRYFSYVWRRLNKVRLLSQKANVYFSFHNMTLPGRRLADRMIASNLDLIPLLLEEYKNLGRSTPEEQKATYQRVVELADTFISISSFSKDQLVQVLDVPEHKVEVVYLAADPSFKPAKDVERKIKESYIFTLGGSEPRKNAMTVIEAYNLLPIDLRDKFKLVIAGGKWHGRKLTYEPTDNIIELGYVPDGDLPGLYAHASLFVFASVYEGFGFTILEAMAAGAPVINAHGSSLDEVAGRATLSFEATNSRELSEQLARALADEDLRKDLVKKGYLQTEKFSWKVSAEKLHQILTQI